MNKKLIDISNKDLPKDSRFGLFFSFIFFICGIYLQYINIIYISYLLFIFSVILLIISFVRPKALNPLNKLWMQFGYLIGKIISPIILGIIFFGLLTPMSIIMRLFGRDELNLRFIENQNQSYWKPYKSINKESEKYKNQF